MVVFMCPLGLDFYFKGHRRDFFEILCNKTSKKSPLWPSKVKKQSRRVTKKLPFEEAFMTHHIFFPQKVVVLRKTSILLWKNDILWKASTTYETSCFVWVTTKNFPDLNLVFNLALVRIWFLYLHMQNFMTFLKVPKSAYTNNDQNNVTQTEDLIVFLCIC